MGAIDGLVVGPLEGCCVGCRVGLSVGLNTGANDGCSVGELLVGFTGGDADSGVFGVVPVPEDRVNTNSGLNFPDIYSREAKSTPFEE